MVGAVASYCNYIIVQQTNSFSPTQSSIVADIHQRTIKSKGGVYYQALCIPSSGAVTNAAASFL